MSQAQGPEAHDGLPIADDGDGIGCCHVLPSLRAGPPQAGPDDLRAQPGGAAHQQDPDVGVLRLPGRQISQQRSSRRGSSVPRQIVADTASSHRFFQTPSGSRPSGPPAPASAAVRKPGGAVDLVQDRRRGDSPPPESPPVPRCRSQRGHPPENRRFSHPQRPNQRPEIGGIDLGLHIPPKERLPVSSATWAMSRYIQRSSTMSLSWGSRVVSSTDLASATACRQRPGSLSSSPLSTAVFSSAAPMRPMIHQHPVRAGTHSGCLQDGLCIVIVIFQFESVDISGVWRAVTKSVSSSSGLRQRRIHSLRTGGVQLRIAAVLKKLGDFLIAAGLQQTLHALRRQQRGLHGPDTGGDRQIIRIFDFVSQGMTSPQPNSR